MEEIIQAIEEFKLIRTRNSITPESLGVLLGNIVEAVSTELTTTIENITEQGNNTVEQVQQQLQETLQSVTEQINSALSSMRQEESEMASRLQQQMSETQNNVQMVLSSIRQEVSDLYNQVSMTALEVTVATSKTEFSNKTEWAKVWNAMQNNRQLPFCIAIVFASGSKNFYYPTCVKNNYISLNAKAGSCELHVNENGTFSISGTNLW